jgi:hypothetical protein
MLPAADLNSLGHSLNENRPAGGRAISADPELNRRGGLDPIRLA